MALTFVALASVTVGSGGAANIEFTSIPGTYTDLLLKASIKMTITTGDWLALGIRFNGSTSGYSQRVLAGDGSTAFGFSGYSGGNRGFVGDMPVTTASMTNTFGSIDIYIPNYTGSNNKSYSVDSVQENNATTSQSDLIAGLWSNTAAITSITLIPDGNNIAQYSTATLYGIKNTV